MSCAITEGSERAVHWLLLFGFQRLSAEVKRLEAQLAMERGEKEMLSAELETLFQRLERSTASTDEGATLARCMRDIITLKKKVHFWHDR